MAILLTVDDLDAVEDVKSRITALLRRAHKIGPEDPDDFQVESSQTLTETIQRVSGTITLVISAVVGISLLVGGVGIMNIMLVSVTERTREIGIAKALGAPRSFILMQFLIEAMVLAVIGGIIGIAFGWLLGVVAAKLIPHFPPPVGAVVGHRRRHGLLRAGRHVVWHPAGAPRRQPRAHRRVATRVIVRARASASLLRNPPASRASSPAR